SDGWFADGPGPLRRLRARDAGVAQHLAHLVARTVENRTGSVRAASGGPAALIAPAGHARTALPGAALVGAVHSLQFPTPYTRFGDLAGPGALLGLAAALVLRSRHRSESSASPARDPADP